MKRFGFKWWNLPQEKKLSRHAVITLVNHTIFQFGNSLSIIFVNLYLWRLTNSLLINGLFNLIALLAAPLATILIGKTAKQRDRLFAYRLGIYLTAFFYLCIVIAQEHMVDYYVAFAFLKGISTACYWLGYFTLMFDVSHDDNRHRYLGWNQILMNVANLVGPVSAGMIITMFADLRGYIFVFMIAFIMFFIAALGSARMEKAKGHRKKYYIKYVPLLLRKHPLFLKTLVGWLIVGLPQGILLYVPPIILFTVFPSEQFVGNMNIVFLGLSIISGYIISRTASVHSTRLYLFIAAIGFSFSSLFLVWEISILSVILFMSVNSIFKPLQANAYAAHYYRWIEKLPLKKHFLVESIVLRESIINVGRALGVILFMLFSSDLNAVIMPWIVVFVMVLQLVVPIIIRRD